LNPIKAALADNASLLNNHAEGNLRVAYADKAGIASAVEDLADLVAPYIPDPPSPNTGYEGDVSGRGWTKLPNGLIVQWGNSGSYRNDWDEGGDTTYYQYFSEPFPNTCFLVLTSNELGESLDDDFDFIFAVETKTRQYFGYQWNAIDTHCRVLSRLTFVAFGY
jgi:hypothetical protein